MWLALDLQRWIAVDELPVVRDADAPQRLVASHTLGRGPPPARRAAGAGHGRVTAGVPAGDVGRAQRDGKGVAPGRRPRRRQSRPPIPPRSPRASGRARFPTRSWPVTSGRRCSHARDEGARRDRRHGHDHLAAARGLPERARDAQDDHARRLPRRGRDQGLAPEADAPRRRPRGGRDHRRLAGRHDRRHRRDDDHAGRRLHDHGGDLRRGSSPRGPARVGHRRRPAPSRRRSRSCGVRCSALPTPTSGSSGATSCPGRRRSGACSSWSVGSSCSRRSSASCRGWCRADATDRRRPCRRLRSTRAGGPFASVKLPRPGRMLERAMCRGDRRTSWAASQGSGGRAGWRS